MSHVTTHVVPRPGDVPLITAWSDYVPVLDKGFVRLEGALAADIDPVNAARVSFDQRAQYHHADCPMTNREKEHQTGCVCDDVQWAVEDGSHRDVLGGADVGLINFLARERHGTPFEHAFFRFEVKAPIFVFREWHRHRIGVSINEQSGRYMELAREFYVPERDAVRIQKGKPGAYYYERVDDDEQALEFQDDLRSASDFAFEEYEGYLRRGFAKEIARLVLPVNTYSTMWWSCNPRSLMAFLSLRNAPNAQREIRLYAEALEDIALQVMPHTFQAFVDGGRVAP